MISQLFHWNTPDEICSIVIILWKYKFSKFAPSALCSNATANVLRTHWRECGYIW